MFYLRDNGKELMHTNVIPLMKKNLYKRTLRQMFILFLINKYKSNNVINNNMNLPLISQVFSGKMGIFLKRGTLKNIRTEKK